MGAREALGLLDTHAQPQLREMRDKGDTEQVAMPVRRTSYAVRLLQAFGRPYKYQRRHSAPNSFKYMSTTHETR
jgi:hypothetical protein